MEIDFDKVSNLKHEYRNCLKDYNAIHNKITSLKKELKHYCKELALNLNEASLNKSISKIKEEIIYNKYFLKKYTKKVTKLKKQIKEAERDFIDDVKLFYLDFENHYGQSYLSYKNNLRYFTGSSNLKINMKYFYYNIKQINKQ